MLLCKFFTFIQLTPALLLSLQPIRRAAIKVKRSKTFAGVSPGGNSADIIKQRAREAREASMSPPPFLAGMVANGMDGGRFFPSSCLLWTLVSAWRGVKGERMWQFGFHDDYLCYYISCGYKERCTVSL